jgi:Tol biopolymer transport system component/DNA-binding winged helix-turn-helix (wHTH) protein
LKGAFHIGDWIVEPQINCIKRGTHSHHLEPKVMQVLVVLASHSDEVLSKERLIHAVWPDTFVSDDVLTRCISELRRTFDDDARSPRFIQTIPKGGYRIIAPVSFPGTPTNGSNGQSVPETTATTLPAVPPRKVGVVIGILSLLLAAVVATWIISGSKGNSTTAYKIVPFTSNLGSESQPAFSPDGNQIAFVWKDEGSQFQHIFVKLIGSETPLQLTSADGDDYSPVYSPDGSSVAFMRTSGNDQGIYIVPVIGGPARKVYATQGSIEWDRGALSWSRDGRTLIFPDGKSANGPSSIYALNLDTLQARQLTSPPRLWDGDYTPTFSPDGTRIAFVRSTEGYVRDIYVMPSSGGEPRAVTRDQRQLSNLAWSADGNDIIFSSDRGGKFSLWRVSFKGGNPERLQVGGEDAFAPAVASKGNHLAYAQRFAKWSIIQIDLGSQATPKPVTKVLSGTQQDSAPQYSPDGSRIAFQSWRSGSQEIWTCLSDGSQLQKLSNFSGPLTGSPSWSPDGQQIVFDSRAGGHSHIYVVPLNGGTPRAVTEGSANDIVPSWSRDGKWLYFGSNRSGVWQIWRTPVLGGEPQQVTSGGGFVGVESTDGKWVFYTKSDTPGLWKIPVSGGPEVKVLDQPPVGFWGYWSLTANKLYFLNSSDGKWAIDALDLKTNRTERIHAVERVPPPFSGLSVSADGKALLHTDLTELGSHITLVENFH